MPIPDFQTIMLPLLAHYSDQQVHANQETYEAMAEYFGLSEEEPFERLPT